MAHVEVYADKQTEKGQAKNYMPPIYRCEGIKITILVRNKYIDNNMCTLFCCKAGHVVVVKGSDVIIVMSHYLA